MALKGDLLRKCSDDRSGRYRPRCQSYQLDRRFHQPASRVQTKFAARQG
jgi:hypothetical protein